MYFSSTEKSAFSYYSTDGVVMRDDMRDDVNTVALPVPPIRHPNARTISQRVITTRSTPERTKMMSKSTTTVSDDGIEAHTYGA